MDPDPNLQRRLARLARHERSPLGPVERERIRARLAAHGRVASPGLGLVLGALAAFGLLLALSTHRQGEEPGREVAVVGATPPRQPSLPLAPPAPLVPDVPPPACARQELPVVRGRGLGQGGSRVLEVGDRARVVVMPGARARVEARGPCATEVWLTGGRVVVHARDLGGGTLRVHAGERSVTVLGTVFDVRSRGASLRVGVAEGTVRVSGSASDELVTVGEALRVAGNGALRRESMAPREVRFLLRTVEAPARVLRRAARRKAEEAPPALRAEVREGTLEVRAGRSMGVLPGRIVPASDRKEGTP